ncbi:MAG: SsrA-binding protein SmpB [Erysipelothrix sp.]|jgi:SsrA-binding protein|nr:SsrA-binding protein SmpB [Erysipelothrix sp.]
MSKVITRNRKAHHDYFIEDKFEAGIVLVGTEIKSIRRGAVQLKDAYVQIKDNEAFVMNMHVAPYEHGNRFNHEETRDRKLLLHKQEIRKIAKAVQQKGYTVVPLSLYLTRGKAKLEIALAKGKATYDKRAALREKDAQREIEKAMKYKY